MNNRNNIAATVVGGKSKSCKLPLPLCHCRIILIIQNLIRAPLKSILSARSYPRPTPGSRLTRTSSLHSALHIPPSSPPPPPRLVVPSIKFSHCTNSAQRAAGGEETALGGAGGRTLAGGKRMCGLPLVSHAAEGEPTTPEGGGGFLLAWPRPRRCRFDPALGSGPE